MRGRSLVLAFSVVVAGALVAPGVDAQSPSPGASAAPVILPAGAQLPVDGDPLPKGFQLWTPGVVAERDGTMVVLGTTGGDGTDAGRLTAAVRAPDGTWSTSAVDDLTGFKPPKGMTASRGFRPIALAAGPDGFAALSRSLYFTDCARACSQDARVVSLIHTSTDGRTWRRADPRTVLGSRAGIALSSVIPAEGGGWIAVGSTAPDLRKPSSVAVLRSTDGKDWRRAATIKAPHALVSRRILQVGDTLVLEGEEYLCSKDSDHLGLVAGPMGTPYITTIAQPRLWRADAPGGDWTPVDLNAAGVMTVPPRSALKPRDCSGLPSQELLDRLDGSGRIVGVAGDRLVAVDDTVTRVATTQDLRTWTAADLPGAVPDDRTQTDRGVVSLAPAVGADGSLELLSVETRRDPAEDWVNAGAQQTLAWRSADAGTTWERLPAGRPYFVKPPGSSLFDAAPTQLTILPDGTAVLDVANFRDLDRPTIRFGTDGPLVPWGNCTLEPGADCRFASIDADAAGADLTGIDLSAARVGYADWSGVTLRDARMREVTLAADLTGADLSGADLGNAHVSGAVTGARATGADLHSAWVDLDLLAAGTDGVRLAGASLDVPAERPDGIDLAGMDLTQVRFSGPYDGVGDLRDLDFGNARLDRASFSGVDLTGAKLGKARYETLTFFDTICPDGKPQSKNAYGPEACRLKRR